MTARSYATSLESRRPAVPAANVRFGWNADIAFDCWSGQRALVRSGEVQKHLFYGTALILLFIGTLSSVFRNDTEAKIVSVVCASILLFVAALRYVRRHQSLP